MRIRVDGTSENISLYARAEQRNTKLLSFQISPTFEINTMAFQPSILKWLLRDTNNYLIIRQLMGSNMGG